MCACRSSSFGMRACPPLRVVVAVGKNEGARVPGVLFEGVFNRCGRRNRVVSWGQVRCNRAVFDDVKLPPRYCCTRTVRSKVNRKRKIAVLDAVDARFCRRRDREV